MKKEHLILSQVSAIVMILSGCSGDDRLTLDNTPKDRSEPGHVALSPEQIAEFGVKVIEAGGGVLRVEVELSGEIVFAPDRLAHIVPRISGVVREVRKGLGEAVTFGEVLVVIESRELADAKGKPNRQLIEDYCCWFHNWA